MLCRRLPMKNAQYCSAALLGRDPPSPTQLLSAWRISTCPAPQLLRLQFGVCGNRSRTRLLLAPRTTQRRILLLSKFFPSRNGRIGTLRCSLAHFCEELFWRVRIASRGDRKVLGTFYRRRGDFGL